MATLREIRRRIASIKNIEQVTDAMRVVAAARLRRAQENITATRPYADKLNTILGHLISQMDTEEQALTHPLLEKREVKHVCIISVSSDRGLCGSFNSNVIRATTQRIAHYQESGADVTLICIGRRSQQHFARRGYDITDAYTNIFRQLEFQQPLTLSTNLNISTLTKRLTKLRLSTTTSSRRFSRLCLLSSFFR